MNRETGQTTDANTQGERNTAPGKTGAMPSQAPLSKMTSGSETLRDHDFPVPVEATRIEQQPVTVDTNKPEPEDARSGGRQGTVPGDTQKKGEVPTIMDQDAVQPDFAAEK